MTKKKKRKIYKRTPAKNLITENKLAIDNKVTKVGFDYGIRPQIMSIANPEFVNLWNKSKSIAMSYSILPELDLRMNIPSIGIVFEQYHYAEELFKLIKSWMLPPCNESAIDIYFVEDTKQNYYYLVMGVNPEQLFIRTFGENCEEDFIPMHLTMQLHKRFTLSENFKNFKKIARDNEVFICPIKAESNVTYPNNTTIYMPITQDQIGFSVGFIKRDIHFLEKESPTTDLKEKFIIDMISSKETEGGEHLSPPIPQPEEVSIFREKQLKRFYTVTIARLPFNQSYIIIKDLLKDEYAEWQILQAACNLFARAIWPEYGYGKNADMIQIYQRLRISTQDATENAILTFKYEVKDIRKQIKNDINYLHSCIWPKSQKEPNQELKSKGYL